MKNNLIYFTLLLIVSLVTSCGPNFIYEKDYEIANQAWTYSDTLDFEIDIVDTTAIYNLYLDLEHSTDYAFQNIYLQVYTQYPNGKRTKDLLPIDIADKSGKWYGKCNSETCQLRVNLQEGAFFNAAGTYVITLEQYMRKESLSGLNSMALRIEDTGKKR